MNYQKEQFNRTLFNPLEKNLLKTYPRLLGLFPNEDERPIEEREKLLRYVIALYDPASPLQKDIPDLYSRKVRAATLAGYDLAKDEARLEAIYAFKEGALISVIDKYLKEYVQSRLWAMIVSFEQTWWELNARMMKPVTAEKDKEEIEAIDKKSKIRAEMGELYTKLDELYDKFYHSDATLQDAVKKRVTPESMAGI